MFEKWLLVLAFWNPGISPSVQVYANDSEQECRAMHAALAQEVKGIAKVTARCYGPVYMEHLISERNKPENQERQADGACPEVPAPR